MVAQVTQQVRGEAGNRMQWGPVVHTRNHHAGPPLWALREVPRGVGGAQCPGDWRGLIRRWLRLSDNTVAGMVSER